MEIDRLYPAPEKSFLLRGPRGTGKSTWLKQILPSALTIDLLNSTRYLELSQTPTYLNNLVAPLPDDAWVIIDEIQRIPALSNATS